MSIAENIQRLRARVEKTCAQVGRKPEDVRIIAVSKYVAVERILEAVEAGIACIGENRVQEAWQKYQVIGDRVRWHLVGHLQTNKVRRALQFVDAIHSVDSLHLAESVQREAEKLQRSVDVLVQVNTSGEASKFGFSPAETPDALLRIQRLENLRVLGLMTIGAFVDDEQVVRRCFAKLRELRDTINRLLPEEKRMKELSMGMTNDFEIAIREGATMIRVGRLIFGERPAK